MKLTRSLRSSYRGSVLLITITVVAISAIVLGSYFTLVQYQTASVARSQAWNASISLSEAGIEEGMALINRVGVITEKEKWKWVNGISADGWGAWDGTSTSLTRYLPTTNIYGTVSSNRYVTTITKVGDSPQVTAVGSVPHTLIPWVFGSEKYMGFMAFPLRPFLAAAGASSASGTIQAVRKVQVETTTDPLFTMALVAKDTIDMNGNNVLSDSYNSSLPNYSKLITNSLGAVVRVYDQTKRRDKGDVGTNSKLVNAASLGNANIWGKLHTGPGSSSTTANIGPNGKVGDATFQASSSTGFQTGAWLYDMNVAMPAVDPPAAGGLMPGPGTYNSVPYTYHLSGNDQKYVLQSGTLSGKVCVSGSNVVLWAKGGLNFGSGGNDSGIYIAPGASVTIYVGTSSGAPVSMDLTGKGGINADGYAKNCQIFGLPTCTSIKMSGNAAFVGTIYAPSAALSGSGGGNNNLDSMGGIIVKTVTLQGHWNFHYDESLKEVGPLRGWIAKNWNETKVK